MTTGLNTQFLEAVKSGDFSLSLELLENGADICSTDDKGATALHLAANRSNRDLMRLLIEQGADVNATDEKGRTALHCASRHGPLVAVRMLIDAGAEIDAQQTGGITPLHDAANFGQMLIAHALIDVGADVAMQDDSGRTALDYATEMQYDEVIQVFEMHRKEQEAKRRFAGETDRFKNNRSKIRQSKASGLKLSQ